MQLRYAGVCKVCGARVAAGERAYWDSVARTVTCYGIECCDVDGLATNKPLTGPWDTRTDIRERAEHRIFDPAPSAPRVTTTRFNSGAVIYRNSRGRCEDAPACG
jgi:hypothetical protein